MVLFSSLFINVKEMMWISKCPALIWSRQDIFSKNAAPKFRALQRFNHTKILKKLILSFLHLLTYAYLVWATSPHHPTLEQNLFCPLVFRHCWRENIRDNKKNIVFLLVWDKDSYTERFLVLLPYICVLQPKLVHLYQTS
jgi:hypothetical protein